MNTPRTAPTICLLAWVLLLAGSVHAEFTNGSFETGDFGGWSTQDLSSPYEALSVQATGTSPAFSGFLGGFINVASDGDHLATTGFDGNGGSSATGPISVAQDVLIDRPLLQFEYRAGWDLLSFAPPGSLDRRFSIHIQPPGGGADLAGYLVFTATAATREPDTGWLAGQADLSAFLGQTVRVVFAWDVPEDFTGPAVAQLDNVGLSGLVDDFRANQQVIHRILPADAGVSPTSYVTNGMAGREREFKLHLLSGPADSGASAGAWGGAFSFHKDADVDARLTMIWDGQDGSESTNTAGLGGVDITFAGTQNALLLGVNSNSRPVMVEITAYSSTADVSSFGLPLPGGINRPTTFRIPYSGFVGTGGGGVDFAHVGAIQLQVEAVNAADACELSLDYLRPDSTNGPPVVGATMTDVLWIDNDGNGKAGAGDTIKYFVVITNGSPSTLSNVVLNVPLGPDTPLVAGSLQISPGALPDSYLVTGNVGIDVPSGSGLLINDNTFGAGGTVTAFEAASANGGSVNVSAGGGFSYIPPAGFNGVDTFTYTLSNTNGSSSATVSLDVSGLIWFVDNTAPPGDGRLGTPFDSLTAFQSVAADGTDDVIFLYSGSGAYLGGINLKDGQRLIGQGAAGADFASVAGITVAPFSVPLPSINAVNPILENASGDGVALALNNDIRGLTVGDTSGTGLSGGAVGSLTITNVIIVGGGDGIDITGGALDVTLDSVATSGNGTGISLDDVSGEFAISGAANLTNSSGVHMNNAAGLTASFGQVHIDATNGDGLMADDVGTLTIGGTVNTIAAINGAAVDLSNANLGTGAFFASVSSTASSSRGVNLDGVTGQFVVTGGLISGATGTAIRVNGGSQSVTCYADIINATGRSVEVTSLTGGSVALGGNIDDTGSGILIQNNMGGSTSLAGPSIVLNTGTGPAVTLNNNSGHSVSFTGGGLEINTTSGAGLTASGGGTLVVAGGNNAIVSTTGTALSVVSTGIGAPGLNFRSISAVGGANGIVLDDTGTLGGLTVTGTGSPGSGGTIQNQTGSNGSTQGIGIYLNNTRGVSLSRMQLNDFDNYAIRGLNVTAFNLLDSVVSGANGNSAADDEGSVRFDNLLGTAAISGCSISGALEDNLRVVNNTGSLNRLRVTNTTISGNDLLLGNDGILIEASGSAVVNASVTDSVLSSHRGDHLQLNLLNSSVADLVFTNNTLAGGHANALGQGITISGGDASALTYNISGNEIQGAVATAINVNLGLNTAANWLGTVANNDIGISGVADSGSASGDGIDILLNAGGVHTATVNNNHVYNYSTFGIRVLARDGGSLAVPGKLNLTLLNNTIAQPHPTFAFNGMLVQAGASSGGGGDNQVLCADIRNNSLAGTGVLGSDDLRVRQRFATTVNLPGYSGTTTDTAAVANFLAGQNTVTTVSATVQTSAPTGGGFTGNPGCP